MSFTNFTLPEKLYYDVVATNLNSGSSKDYPLYFNETRSTPFIQQPERYLMSIVRFTLDTPSLPIFLPSIQPNQNDKDLTIYSITLQWVNPLNPNESFSQQTYVRFQTQDLSATVPLPPSQNPNGLQNNNGGYYYIYNYQYWIYLVDLAFKECFIGLSTKVITAGFTMPTTFPPMMTFDTELNIAILNTDVLGYNTTSNNYIRIFFNGALYQLFSSFPIYIVGPSSQGDNVQIQTFSYGGSNLIPFPYFTDLYTAIQTFQEYSTIALWTPVLSIVFCSNSLPIIPNQISAPLLVAQGNSINNSGNNNNIQPIITDFVADNGIYKPSITYNPSAQFRWCQLQGNRPIYTLDLTVFWKDREGQLQPFRLTSGSSATIKLLFSLKDSFGMSK